MQYKTIVLGLIEEHPALHRQLIQSGTLLQMLQHLATSLSNSHQAWMTKLRTQSVSNPTQLSSAAMELALQELQESLQNASEAGEPLSLEAAMEFIRRHTPAAS